MRFGQIKDTENYWQTINTPPRTESKGDVMKKTKLTKMIHKMATKKPATVTAAAGRKKYGKKKLQKTTMKTRGY